MKKKLFVLFSMLFFLVGCSNKEIEGTYSLKSDSGIYDYLHGDVKNVSEVYAIGSDGSNFKGYLDESGFYQIAIPSLGIAQTIEVVLKNDKESLTENLIIEKKEIISDYNEFALFMNLYIPSINPDAKTEFPLNQADGVSDISVENGVTTSINVYDGDLIGLEMHGSQIANKELQTLLVAFQQTFDITNDRISEAFNNTLDTGESHSFTSKGFQFTFEYSDNDLFASIIKTK